MDDDKDLDIVDATSQQLVVIPPAGQPMDLRRDSGRYWTNLPCKTLEERFDVLDVLNGPVGQLRQEVNKTLMVKGLAVIERTWLDEESGELVTRQLIVLVTTDGLRLGVWGDSARQCLGRILSVLPEGPWESPWPLHIATLPGKGDRYVYSITVDRSALKQTPQKGRK